MRSSRDSLIYCMFAFLTILIIYMIIFRSQCSDIAVSPANSSYATSDKTLYVSYTIYLLNYPRKRNLEYRTTTFLGEIWMIRPRIGVLDPLSSAAYRRLLPANGRLEARLFASSLNRNVGECRMSAILSLSTNLKEVSLLCGPTKCGFKRHL